MRTKGFSSLIVILLLSLIVIPGTLVYLKNKKNSLPPTPIIQEQPLISPTPTIEKEPEARVSGTLKGNIYIYDNTPDTPIIVDSIEFYLLDKLGNKYKCDVTKLSDSQYMASLEDLRKGLLTIYTEVKDGGERYPNLQNNFSYIIHTSNCKTQTFDKIGVKVNYNPSYLKSAPQGVFEKV